MHIAARNRFITQLEDATYYAVVIGKFPGIYDNLELAQSQVFGVRGAC